MTRRRPASAIVAGAVAMMLVPMGSAWAAIGVVLEPGAIEPASTVTVDATEVGTMSARKVDDVAAKATRAVTDAGLTPAAVRVTFVEVDPVEVRRGVRVTLAHAEAPVVDAEGDPRGPVLASCTACSDAELAGLAIEAVLEAIERHRDALEAQRAAAEAARATEATAAEAGATEPEPASEEPEHRRRLGTLGWSGITALGLGTAAVVTGAVLASRPPAPFPGERDVTQLRDVRPPGYAALGVGAALVITGAVLLAVDRRRARSTQLAGAPWLAPGTVGVALARRW